MSALWKAEGRAEIQKPAGLHRETLPQNKREDWKRRLKVMDSQSLIYTVPFWKCLLSYKILYLWFVLRGKSHIALLCVGWEFGNTKGFSYCIITENFVRAFLKWLLQHFSICYLRLTAWITKKNARLFWLLFQNLIFISMIGYPERTLKRRQEASFFFSFKEIISL